MTNFTVKVKVLLVMMSFTCNVMIAQKQTSLDIALRYVEQNFSRWNLDKTDVADLAVNNQYDTKHNGATHIYFLQRFQGIPVHNGVMGVHVAKGKVIFATSRFIPNLVTKVNTTEPGISPEAAIFRAAAQLELPGKAAPVFRQKTEKGEWVFEDSGISRSPIKVKLMYQRLDDETVRLAWDLAIQQLNTSDYWSVRIDALDGKLLSKHNWTVYCNLPQHHLHRHDEACLEKNDFNTNVFKPVREALTTLNLLDNAQYNVFPIPLENPVQGERQVLQNPADPTASPYGWHDTNGISGSEYTITRGNNAHAFSDVEATNSSKNDEPNGGAPLIFDFPFDPNGEPDFNKNAATTQLFYMNNVVHDFAYHYGFDEPAGNFQQNNYGKGADGNDYVLAQSQDGAGLNNANFSTPPDGANGAMQMFLWSRPIDANFFVNAPAAIAREYEIGNASFGLRFSETPISGQVVQALDNSTNPKLACNAIVNTNEVAGKIAMIDRGECFFKRKVWNAQQAGAIGVIICNYDDVVIGMGDVQEVPNPSIPSVSLKSSDCILLRQNLDKGVTVTFQLPQSTGPSQLDGSFDNGIIAHEYGHGISNRLTGGPALADCLFNSEQMGEGWSDFFAYVMTIKAGDDGATPRGIGNYVTRTPSTDKSFRNYPYSTDMSINPLTYDGIITTNVPHGLGEVWAVTLWDLYWKFVEIYGWDPDLYFGTGGNNMVIRLVMDGMKLQACQPGFLDGRDAILAADALNYDGVHECLIWEVFARRGLGWQADQGSSFSREDGFQDFSLLPECTKELKITKTVTDLIDPGEQITAILRVTNHKETAVTGVVVTDLLPEGTSFVPNSATGGAQVSSQNGQVIFEVGDMQPGDERIFTYKMNTDPASASIRLFFDDVEQPNDFWSPYFIKGLDVWDISDRNAFSGSKAWFVPDTTDANDQVLQLANPILVAGNQPVLRFYHFYETEPVTDAGFVQISTDAGNTWQDLAPHIFKNGYRGKVAANTFQLLNQNAFWGNSKDFVDTYIDLSSYIGQEILFRFRFGSDAESDNEDALGWFVDDIEVMDMVNYNAEACVTSEEGDQACAVAASRGTIVQSDNFTSSEEPEQNGVAFQLYPNPAKNIVNISITSPENGQAVISILSPDGKRMLQQQANFVIGNQVLPLSLANLPSGFYFVEIKAKNAIRTQKLIIK